MCIFQPFTDELHSCSYVKQLTVLGNAVLYSFIQKSAEVRNLALAGRNRWHYSTEWNLRFIQNVASCYVLCLTKESVISATLVHAPVCVCVPRTPRGGLSDTSALEISSGGGSVLNSLLVRIRTGVRTLRSPGLCTIIDYMFLLDRKPVPM